MQVPVRLEQIGFPPSTRAPVDFLFAFPSFPAGSHKSPFPALVLAHVAPLSGIKIRLAPEKSLSCRPGERLHGVVFYT